MHDRTTLARKAGARRLQVVNNRGPAYFGVAVGDEIELREEDFSPTGWCGRIVAVERDGYVFDHDVPWPGLVTDILIEKCRFVNPRDFVWHILNGGEMTFRDNRIELGGDAPYVYLPYAGSLYAEQAKAVHCSGNVFVSKEPREAGVYK